MPLLFGAIVAAAIVAGWFTITMKPPAARMNLSSPTCPWRSRLRRLGLRALGGRLRRFVPTSLIKTMEAELAQAGHPHGIDMPKAAWHPGRPHDRPVACSASWLGSHCSYRGGAGRVHPSSLLDLQGARRRQEAVSAAVSDTLDQLTICVESGLGFDAALLRVARPTTVPSVLNCSTPSATSRPVCPGTRLCGRWQGARGSLDEDGDASPHPGSAPRYATGRNPPGPGGGDPGQAQAGHRGAAAKLGRKAIFPTVLLFFPLHLRGAAGAVGRGLADAFQGLQH